MWTWILVVVAVVAIAVFAQRQITAPSRRRKLAVEDALQRANLRVEAQPDDSGAQVELARVHLELAGKPDRAREIVERILETEPHHWSEGEKPTRVILGEAFVGLKQLDRAIEIYTTFLESVGEYETGGDSERKWLLETHKVDSEQRIRLLRKGDTHVPQPEQWGDTSD